MGARPAARLDRARCGSALRLHRDAYFVENETNFEALYGSPNPQPYVKDGIDRAVRGEAGSTNPGRSGTKLGLHYEWTLGPGETAAIRREFEAELRRVIPVRQRRVQ